MAWIYKSTAKSTNRKANRKYFIGWLGMNYMRRKGRTHMGLELINGNMK